MIPKFATSFSYLFQIFHEATMERIVQKQFLLTGYLEYLIKK